MAIAALVHTKKPWLEARVNGLQLNRYSNRSYVQYNPLSKSRQMARFEGATNNLRICLGQCPHRYRRAREPAAPECSKVARCDTGHSGAMLTTRSLATLRGRQASYEHPQPRNLSQL